MKNISFSLRQLWSVILVSVVPLTGCDPHMIESILNTPAGSVPLSQQEVVAGLKEALRIGAEQAVRTTSKDGGFNLDPVIRIPFPEDARKAKEWAVKNGLSSKVTAFENQINKAAEHAAREAVPVLTDAITGMTVQDGFAILRGDSLAATQYLRDKTTQSLSERFRPIADQVIQELRLTSFWEPIATAYNASTLFTGQAQVSTDLGAYVTDQSLAGLFHYIGEEEKKIRRDPAARVTDLLVRVFGSPDR
jgi:hypothetical protein